MCAKQKRGREGLTPEEVRKTAISALENAGVQTTGNEEVNRLVDGFVKDYANHQREEVREAAENLAEKWRSKGVTELEPVTITGKPAEQDLWEQAIARREAGERPPSAEELTPAQQGMVRKAKAEARGKAEGDMGKYRTGREAEKPDIALAQAEINEQKAEREAYAAWLKNNPSYTAGRNAFRTFKGDYREYLNKHNLAPEPKTYLAFKAELEGSRAGTKPAEPETEIAEREPTVAEPTEVVKNELKSCGVDLDEFREDYSKLESETAETNEELADVNRRAAEMTGNALEKIRSSEEEIREKYKNNPEVLAALDERVNAIQNVHDNSLEQAEKYEKAARAETAETEGETEELAKLARERWKPEEEEQAEPTAAEPEETEGEPTEVAKKEPVAPVEEPIKPEPVETEPEVAQGETEEGPTARDILEGIDFGTAGLGEFDAEKRRAELKKQQKEAEGKSEATGSRGLAGRERGEDGEEVAEVKPSTAGEETEGEKRRLLAQMSGEGPEAKLGPLRGRAEEQVAPKTGPVAVLKLSPAQRDVLDYGTPGEKRELRAQLMDRKRRTERMVETARARGEETEPLQNEIAAIDDLLKDKRLSGA